jgi:hypothetical protein
VLQLTFNGAIIWRPAMLPKFDAYEVRALLAVAIIVGLPVVLPVVSLAPADWLGRLGLGAISVFILYGFGFCVAGLGRRAERHLWKEWGGPPSTRFCRWSDETWGKTLKERIHGAIARTFGLELFQRRRERENPEGAAQAIKDAFARVRSYLRQHDANGLWYSHNAEYGFARNLTGSALLGALFAVLGCAGSLILWWYQGGTTALILAIVEALFVPVFIVLHRFMPVVTKQRAERYAESAWHAFLNLADSTAQAAPQTSLPSPKDSLPSESTSTTPKEEVS